MWEDYAESAIEYLKEECGEEPTEESIWNEISFQDQTNWEEEKSQLVDFFAGNTWILQGINERWDGKHSAGHIFSDFMEMFYKACEDCDYIKIWDENGHFYLQCFHHDGTNIYEIKRVTEAGKRYLENWEYCYSDHRSVEYIHTRVMKRYSTLPHYAHKVFGSAKVAYEKAAA